MYTTQAHLSYHYPAQIQTLGKGGVMWSVDLLPDIGDPEYVSSE